MEDEISTTLMGLVEMDAAAASKELSSMERVRLARTCRNAVSKGGCKESTKLRTKDCFTNVQAMSQPVKIKLSDADISIIYENKMINHHIIKEISSVAALVDVESQVVYIGHCSISNKIIAVILSFGSLKCARALVNNIQQNQKAVQRSEQFQAKDMVGVFTNTLRLSMGDEISVKPLDEPQPNTPNLHMTNDDKQTTIPIVTDTKRISSSNDSKNELSTDKESNESDYNPASIPQPNIPNLQMTNADKETTIPIVTNTKIISSSNESKNELSTDTESNELTSSSNNPQSSITNDSVSTIAKADHNSIENVENMAAPIPQTFAPLLTLQPDYTSKSSNSLKKDSSLMACFNSVETDHATKDNDKQQCQLDQLLQSKPTNVEEEFCDNYDNDNQNNNNILTSCEEKPIKDISESEDKVCTDKTHLKKKSCEEKTIKDISASEDKVCTDKTQLKKKKKSFLSSLKVSRSRRNKYRHQPHIQFLISQISSTDIIGETHRTSSISDQQIVNESHNIKITGKGDCISDFSDSDEDSSFNKGDNLYELLGLKREDQERIYIDFAKYESIPGDTPEEKIGNQINYLLNDEYMYLETTKLLAVGKDSFPDEIQLLIEPLETLPEFHDDLYRSLYDGLNDQTKIAKVFLERKDSFPVYESILVNSFEVERILSIIPESEKACFAHLLEPLKVARRRLHFYFSILDSMLKLTSSEKNLLQEAADIIRGYCQRADTIILINSIRNSPINLHVFKPLLLHSCFNITGPKLDETKLYRVLLFETLLVVTDMNKHYNDYQFDIRIELALLTLNEDDNCFSLEIERSVFKNEKFIFKTTEKYIKKMWCNEISEVQRKYLEKIENTLT